MSENEPEAKTETEVRFVDPRKVDPLTLRPCDECYACCVWLGINALKKFPGQSCRHLDGNLGPKTRCAIYQTRPDSCIHYSCGWRAGLGQATDRPDKSGVLVSIYPNGDWEPGQDIKSIAATITLIDPTKSGDIDDPNSNIQRLLRILIEDGVDNIRIINKDKILYLTGGAIRRGEIVKRPKSPDSYESLDFVVFDPPVGKYELKARDRRNSP